MSSPIIRLLDQKDYSTIRWLAEHRCKKHNHLYITHYSCYLKESDKPEKIGFLDIESGGSLTADWGIMLSWAIKPLNSDKILGFTVSSEEILNPKIRDSILVETLCSIMKQFDTLIVYYGKDTGGRGQRHDIPFSRTRALTYGLTNFPKAGSLKIVDVYDIVKNKFKLTVRKQEAACRQFHIPYGKHCATPNIWFSALQGNKEALQYVWKHNCEDVKALEKLWKKVCGFYAARSKI